MAEELRNILEGSCLRPRKFTHALRRCRVIDELGDLSTNPHCSSAGWASTTEVSIWRSGMAQ